MSIPLPSQRPLTAITLADLPPIDDRFHATVALAAHSLLAVADELGARSFTLDGDQVTFVEATAQGLRRWRGTLGGVGLVPA